MEDDSDLLIIPQVHTVYEEKMVMQHSNITGVGTQITEMVRSVSDICIQYIIIDMYTLFYLSFC